MVNRTEIRAQKWRDDVFLRCGIELPYLPRHYNSFRVRFSIGCSLGCKKGGLITSCTNKLHDRVANLSSKLRDDPLVNPGHTVRSGKALQYKSNPPNNPTETAVDSEHKVYPLIR